MSLCVCISVSVCLFVCFANKITRKVVETFRPGEKSRQRKRGLSLRKDPDGDPYSVTPSADHVVVFRTSDSPPDLSHVTRPGAWRRGHGGRVRVSAVVTSIVQGNAACVHSTVYTRAPGGVTRAYTSDRGQPTGTYILYIDRLLSLPLQPVYCSARCLGAVRSIVTRGMVNLSKRTQV